MCELRNSHYDMDLVKWKALIGLEAVSKSLLLYRKVNFLKQFCMCSNNVPLNGITCNIIIGVYLNGCR
jgi:hypothetical protein